MSNEAGEVSPADVFGLVPDRFGITVVAVGDLTDRLNDGEALDEALSNAGIDSHTRVDAELVERVRALNLTGDTDAYWGRPPRAGAPGS